MRLALALVVVLAAAGATTLAQARCEACPKGMTFWHSKNACLADDGSGHSAPPLYWKHEREAKESPLHGKHLGGRTGGKSGPAGDR